MDTLKLLTALSDMHTMSKVGALAGTLAADKDGNGRSDIVDLFDKNGDGILDLTQKLDADGNGELDVKQILDKNNNGVPDAFEVGEEVFEYTISENKLHHIEKHTLESIVEQSKYLDDEQLTSKLESSFFSPKWSVEETKLYVQEAYNDLRTQGIIEKKVSYHMHGEIIEIVIKRDGSLATAYGKYHFTVEEIRELARRL